MLQMQGVQSHDAELSIVKSIPDKFELKKSICATWNEMEGIEIEEDSDNVVFQGH